MGTFRDDIVLEIIQQSSARSSTAVHDNFTIRHGSVAISGKRKRCAVCHVKCTRECKDCAFTPGLCQSNKKSVTIFGTKQRVQFYTLPGFPPKSMQDFGLCHEDVLGDLLEASKRRGLGVDLDKTYLLHDSISMSK